MSSAAAAQPLSEQETYAMVGKQLQDIQDKLHPSAGELVTSTAPLSYKLGDLPGAIEIAQGLRDALRGNPWIQVKGFTVTVGWPPGITFEFEIPELAKAQKDTGASHAVSP